MSMGVCHGVRWLHVVLSYALGEQEGTRRTVQFCSACVCGRVDGCATVCVVCMFC